MDDDSSDETAYVKLISAEGSEIFLARRIAVKVEMIKAMLEGGYQESETGVIRFPDISTNALEKVVKYLHYKDRYSNSSLRIPEFTIDPEDALEVLVAALTCTLHHHITSLVTEIHVVLLYVWALITSTHLTEQCLWGKYNIWLLALTLGKAR
ncbi:hypothetical protein THAOC_03695 [Thalassiosira oceanica]|uniref:Elongin-C n=1 Tax=Thalassiosira oceanica TaxID=159749 RepID=K0TKJ7_THAOC|nr:hypothetical protein THAOC_03695 [Thalassiosira oceanica]|eukprot:EJK74616.1 hypothetical protein THAOC_03695 [Thalassiosira oceanica]